MSIFNVLEIASTGMSAQSIRLNTISSNMANVETASHSKETAYHSKHPVFASFNVALDDFMNADPSSMGVIVKEITESKKAPEQRYEPGNPMADENGFVYYSNVNPVQEMADMIAASRSYQNNAQLISNVSDLMKQTINLGK